MSERAPVHVKDESHVVVAEFQHLSLCVQADDGGFLVMAPKPGALLQPIKLSQCAFILLWAQRVQKAYSKLLIGGCLSACVSPHFAHLYNKGTRGVPSFLTLLSSLAWL